MLQSCRCCCWRMPLAKSCTVIGNSLAVLSVVSAIRSGIALMKLPAHDSVAFLGFKLQDQIERAQTQLLWHTCVSVAFAIFCWLLVLGVSRQSSCLVMTFLIFFGLYLTMVTGVMLYSLYDPSLLIPKYDADKLNKEHGSGTAKLVINIGIGVGLALAAFFWYLWLVVLSFYKELTGSDGPAGGPPDTWHAKQDGRQMPMV